MTKSMPWKLTLTLVFLILLLSPFPAPSQSQTEFPVPVKCQNETVGDFSPRAITLTSVNVRAQTPEYSYLKGEWILGRTVDVLPPNTCLAILNKEMVGVIQIWYQVQYRKPSNPVVHEGWVWGGTKDVDERYIGGDRRTPAERKERRSSSRELDEISSWVLGAGPVYAQVDSPPGNLSSLAQQGSQSVPAVPVERTDGEVPILGWSVSVGTASAIVLFLTMVAGMFAKTIWDQTQTGESLVLPSFVKVIRPLLISPIAFSAFWGPMYVQQGVKGLNLTLALYAFQIGFMWQHVLEKKQG